jgi:hypothetical protein
MAERQLPEVVRPHVASFNYMLESGLKTAVQLMEPVIIDDAAGQKPRVKLWVASAEIGFPARSGGTYREARIFPNEVFYASLAPCIPY